MNQENLSILAEKLVGETIIGMHSALVRVFQTKKMAFSWAPFPHWLVEYGGERVLVCGLAYFPYRRSRFLFVETCKHALCVLPKPKRGDKSKLPKFPEPEKPLGLREFALELAGEKGVIVESEA